MTTIGRRGRGVISLGAPPTTPFGPSLISSLMQSPPTTVAMNPKHGDYVSGVINVCMSPSRQKSVGHGTAANSAVTMTRRCHSGLGRCNESRLLKRMTRGRERVEKERKGEKYVIKSFFGPVSLGTLR